MSKVTLPATLVQTLVNLAPGRVKHLDIDGETFAVIRLEDLDHILEAAGLTRTSDKTFVWSPQS